MMPAMSSFLRRIPIAAATILLALALHADVRGTLITADGAPVVGGRIQLFTASATSEQLEAWRAGKELEPIATAQSDSKGNFKVEIAKSGNYVLAVTASGYAPTGIETTGTEDLGGLLMRRAAMKMGRVTAGGKPVADAVVVSSGDVTQSVTRTDAEGRYSIADPAVWTPRLLVMHPRFASWVDRREPGNPPVKLDVRLVPGLTLRGRVVAQDGKTGVSANLFLDGQPAGASAADGTFTIEHASADWKEVAALSSKLVARAGRAGLSAMRLSRAVTLTGSVVDAKSRIPLPGAIVALQVSREDPRPVAEVTSDSKGAFAIPGLLPGEFRISVRHAGYGRTWLTQSVAAPTSRAIYLRKDARVSGIISDSERKGVAGALVGVVPRARGWMVMPQDALVSAPDGRYSRRIPADRLDLGDVDARVEKSGYAVTNSGPHTLASGDEKVINVTLSRGVVLSGRVIDGKGEPISGVAVATAEFDSRVMVRFQGDWSTLPQTGNDGRFALQVRPGAYTLTFVRTGFGPRVIRDVKANSDATPIEVTLEPSVSISGRVITSAGEPVPEATVDAYVAGPAIRVITSDSGSFVLDGLPAELVSVSVYKESMNATEERQIKAPASDVKIELTPGVKVSGRVTAKGGSAVADFTIDIVARLDGGFISDGSARTQQFHDSEGRFTIEQVPVRPCDLLVKAPGYATARVALPLEKGKDIDGFEVTLDRAGTLRGRITGENGTPVARATVRVDGESGQRETNVEPAVSDANGD